MTERGPFPPGCPVTPLGVLLPVGGLGFCRYRSAFGHVVSLAPADHGTEQLLFLFGGSAEWLEVWFPRLSAAKVERDADGHRKVIEPEQIVGFRQFHAAMALIAECCRLGEVE